MVISYKEGFSSIALGWSSGAGRDAIPFGVGDNATGTFSFFSTLRIIKCADDVLMGKKGILSSDPNSKLKFGMLGTNRFAGEGILSSDPNSNLKFGMMGRILFLSRSF